MNEAEVREKLDVARLCRVPVFKREERGKARVSALEEAMLLSAFHSAELFEVRFDLLDEKRPLDDEWFSMVGWEGLRATGRKTEAGVDEAKARLKPDVAKQRDELAWWITRLTEEIDRLERDATKCSRAYAMISGT